jgi:hypothetical protein
MVVQKDLFASHARSLFSHTMSRMLPSALSRRRQPRRRGLFRCHGLRGESVAAQFFR